MYRVSIIMPVYNSIETLDYAVESLVNQTLHDLEIILVNDGSTDGSGDLCEELSKKHNNIRVYHQENQGCNYALAVGIEHASSEYISYIDSDDFALPYMYEKLYKAIQKSDADIVRAGLLRVHSKNLLDVLPYAKKGTISGIRNIAKIYEYPDKLYNQTEFVEDFFENRRANSCTQLIIKKSILDISGFKNNLRYATDLYLWLDIFEKNRELRIYTIPDIVYIYFSNRQGNMSSVERSKEWWNSCISVLNRKIQFCKIEKLSSTYHRTVNELFNEFNSKRVDIRKRGALSSKLRKETYSILRNSLFSLFRDRQYPVISKIGLMVFCISPSLYYMTRRVIREPIKITDNNICHN